MTFHTIDNRFFFTKVFRRTFWTALLLFIYPCSPSNAEEEAISISIWERVLAAACHSQAWLQANGYLERLDAANTEYLSVEVPDAFLIRKGADGKPDIQSLLDARAGTFSGKLYGVRLSSGEQTADAVADVGYRLNDSDVDLRCVMTAENGAWTRLIHQGCIDRDFIRVSEAELNCTPSQIPIFE